MTKTEKANYEIITDPKKITDFLRDWWSRNANEDIFHKGCYMQEAFDSVDTHNFYGLRTEGFNKTLWKDLFKRIGGKYIRIQKNKFYVIISAKFDEVLVKKSA